MDEKMVERGEIEIKFIEQVRKLDQQVIEQAKIQQAIIKHIR